MNRMSLRHACSTMYAMSLEGRDEEAREELDALLNEDDEDISEGIDGATMRAMKFQAASQAMVAAGRG